MSIERIESKVDECKATLHRLEVYVSKNTEDLEEHIRRTNILENRQQKIIHAILFLSGGLTTTVGPQIIKVIGALL